MTLPRGALAGCAGGHAVPRTSFPLVGLPKDGLEMYALQEVLGPLMYGYVWFFMLCFDGVFIYRYFKIYIYMYMYLLS